MKSSYFLSGEGLVKYPPSEELLETLFEGDSGTGQAQHCSSIGLQLLDSMSASERRKEGPRLDCPRS